MRASDSVNGLNGRGRMSAAETAVKWTDIANLALVAVLVGATCYYAWRTHSMVKEMREARRMQLLPRLKLTLHWIGVNHSDVRIVNAGVGPAVDVEMDVWFGEERYDLRQWKKPLMAPGEYAEFFYPLTEKNQTPTNDEIKDLWRTVNMSARYKDAVGESFTANESLDVGSLWDAAVGSREAVQEPEIRKIREKLERIEKALGQVAGAVRDRSR